MAFLLRLVISITVLFSANFAAVASGDESNLEQQIEFSQPTEHRIVNGESPFMDLMSKYQEATLAAGRCTGDYDCKWPTTNCKNNRCVTPNGDSGQCTGDYDCRYPTTNCERGRCVKPGGGGGECTGDYNCSWPYNSCKSGFCERP